MQEKLQCERSEQKAFKTLRTGRGDAAIACLLHFHVLRVYYGDSPKVGGLDLGVAQKTKECVVQTETNVLCKVNGMCF